MNGEIRMSKIKDSINFIIRILPSIGLLFIIMFGVYFSFQEKSSNIGAFLIYFLTYYIGFIGYRYYKNKLKIKQFEIEHPLKALTLIIFLALFCTLFFIILFFIQNSYKIDFNNFTIRINWSEFSHLMGVRSSNNFILVLSVLDSVLIGPIFEELFFRQIPFAIGKTLPLNNLLLILITSFIFMLAHGSFSIERFIIGLITGLLYVKYQNIKPSIIYHQFSNFFIIILNLLVIN